MPMIGFLPLQGEDRWGSAGVRQVHVTVIEVTAAVIDLAAGVIRMCGKGWFAVVWRGAYM